MKGIYLLIIKVKKKTKIKVGALGMRIFPKGTYAYVGSAQNGIEQRVRRHLRISNKGGNKAVKGGNVCPPLRWHIDYLLDSDFVKIEKLLYKKAAKTEECEIAQNLSICSEPVFGFGCSDCKCGSHLFFEPKITQLNLKTWPHDVDLF